MKSDIFLTVLRRNTFNNIDQKYFQLLVFQGKKALMEKSDQNRQRKKKREGKKQRFLRKKNYYLVRWLLKNYLFFILDSSDFRIDPVSGSSSSL